jgi:hypothetical protein
MGKVGGRNGEKLNAYMILVEISESKMPRGRVIHRWEYNIRMYHKEITREDV